MTPGEHLRAEIQRLGLDQGVVASETEVSRQTINNIVNDRQPISRSMAAKLGRVTGQSSDYWLRSSFPELQGSERQAQIAIIPEGQRRFPNTLLVNHQIVAAVKRGIVGIDPFSEQKVQRASIDLTLDDFIITADGQRVDITNLKDQCFPLQSQQIVNARTREWVEFPLDYVGRVGPMTEVAKYGILLSHGLQIDPGFKGYLQFCLFNASMSSYELRSGRPIISLEIIPLASLPHVNPNAARAFDTGDERHDVASHFEGGTHSNASRQLVLDLIGKQVRTSARDGQVVAQIELVDIRLTAPSEKDAIAAVAETALHDLQTLRSNPGLQVPHADRYGAFADMLADELLSLDECLAAVAALRLPFTDPDQRIVRLRSGKSGLLRLPLRNTRMRLGDFAQQLDLRPDELLLMLAGRLQYLTFDDDKERTTIN